MKWPLALKRNNIYIRDARDERNEQKSHPDTLSDTERMYNERTHVRANIKYVGVSTHTHTHIQHKWNSGGWEERKSRKKQVKCGHILPALTLWEMAVEKTVVLPLGNTNHRSAPFPSATFRCCHHNCPKVKAGRGPEAAFFQFVFHPFTCYLFFIISSFIRKKM